MNVCRRRLRRTSLFAGFGLIAAAMVLSACSSSSSAKKSATPSGSTSSATPAASATNGSEDGAPSRKAKSSSRSKSSAGAKSPSAPAPGAEAGGPTSRSSTLPPSGEGVAPPAGKKCTFTSATAVATAFGATISSYTTGTTGTGRPICTFVLSSSNVGVSGHVTAVRNDTSSAAEFTQAQQSPSDAVVLTGVGDRAFYSPSQSTIQLMKGKTVVVVQASLRSSKPAAVNSDLIALGRSIAAEI
jgi:hypothetical protein